MRQPAVATKFLKVPTATKHTGGHQKHCGNWFVDASTVLQLMFSMQRRVMMTWNPKVYACTGKDPPKQRKLKHAALLHSRQAAVRCLGLWFQGAGCAQPSHRPLPVGPLCFRDRVREPFAAGLPSSILRNMGAGRGTGDDMGLSEFQRASAEGLLRDSDAESDSDGGEVRKYDISPRMCLTLVFRARGSACTRDLPSSDARPGHFSLGEHGPPKLSCRPGSP